MLRLAPAIIPEKFGVRSLCSAILCLAILLICTNIQEATAQRNEQDDEISQKAQSEEAMKTEYDRGYEDGKRDAAGRIYGRYMAMSIVVGLFIAAVIVSILLWSEMSDRVKDMRKSARVRAFARNVNARLNPELRHRAMDIAQRKEKLRDAISRETDSSLVEAALSVLPKLDDLSGQAALLLELRQNLSDYIEDIDPAKLEAAQSDCEEKLKAETDAEAKRALEYQLKQVTNERVNYSKAQAKIRTCDAVLNGIAARIDATSLDLMSLPSVLIKKQEFFEKISIELDEEINLTRDAAETVMEESK